MRGEKRDERRERKGERREEGREKRGEERGERRKERREKRGEERGERRKERREEREKGMTPDLSLQSGFARGVLLSLHVRDTCLHSGSWLLSGSFLQFCCALSGNVTHRALPRLIFLVQRVRKSRCRCRRFYLVQCALESEVVQARTSFFWSYFVAADTLIGRVHARAGVLGDSER